TAAILAAKSNAPTRAVMKPETEAHMGAKCARFWTVSTTIIIDGTISGPRNKCTREPTTTTAAEATGLVRRNIHGDVCNTRIGIITGWRAQGGQWRTMAGKEVTAREATASSRVSPNNGTIMSPSVMRGCWCQNRVARSKTFTNDPPATAQYRRPGRCVLEDSRCRQIGG